jgi:AraC-like DNA-binding protein
MEVTVLKPANTALGSFIRYFYFLKSEQANFKQTYATFPQLTTPLSLFTRVRSRLDADRRHASVWYDPKSKPHGEVDGIFTRPMIINYRGIIDEVTVVFEPLGLNQFLRCDLSEVAVGPASRRFNPYGAVFDQLLSKLFATRDMYQRRKLLEEFFLTQYQPFRNEILSRSLKCLIEDDNMSVSRIARSVGVSHKTLTRMFQRHLGATPVVLRKIARFRRSLDLTFGSRPPHTSTEIALMSHYYDQSQFIRQYHQLAGDSPTRLYRNVSNIGGENIFWRML